MTRYTASDCSRWRRSASCSRCRERPRTGRDALLNSPTGPPQALADHLGYIVNWAAMHSRRASVDALAPLGLDPRGYGVLVVAATAPGATQQQLAKLAQIDPSSLVGLIDELEASGLVERRQDIEGSPQARDPRDGAREEGPRPGSRGREPSRRRSHAEAHDVGARGAQAAPPQDDGRASFSSEPTDQPRHSRAAQSALMPASRDGSRRVGSASARTTSPLEVSGGLAARVADRAASRRRTTVVRLL